MWFAWYCAYRKNIPLELLKKKKITRNLDKFISIILCVKDNFLYFFGKIGIISDFKNFNLLLIIKLNQVLKWIAEYNGEKIVDSIYNEDVNKDVTHPATP